MRPGRPFLKLFVYAIRATVVRHPINTCVMLAVSLRFCGRNRSDFTLLLYTSLTCIWVPKGLFLRFRSFSLVVVMSRIVPLRRATETCVVTSSSQVCDAWRETCRQISHHSPCLTLLATAHRTAWHTLHALLQRSPSS